jgi:hypothetical protein
MRHLPGRTGKRKPAQIASRDPHGLGQRSGGFRNVARAWSAWGKAISRSRARQLRPRARRAEPDNGQGLQRQHLDTKGEGVFHLGLEVRDAVAAQPASGFPVGMRGRRADRTGLTSYDTAGGAGVMRLTRAIIMATESGGAA